MSSRYALLLASCLLLAGTLRAAEPPRPRGPDTYDVLFRYRIEAYRTQRIEQFEEMMNFLKRLQFVPDRDVDQDADNPEAERMSGTVPSANARKMLDERHIRSLLLIPHGTKAAEKAEAPVRVQLELTGDLPLDRQHLLADQTRKVLATLGFQEAIGYDHRGYRRLAGSLPVGQLDKLISDLRRLPAGAEEPAPFARQSPVLVTEVFPEYPPLSAPPKLPEPPPAQWKIGPELRALLGAGAENAPPIRIEVILNFTPAANDTTWQKALEQAAPGSEVEGAVGSLVTMRAGPQYAVPLATLPIVATVRLPALARPQARAILPAAEKDNEALLKATSLDKLHGLGFKGRGVRVAVVDSDFRGWTTLAGTKPPRKVHYVDFTAEHSPALLPDPMAEDSALGHGTRCALAVLVAAPEAELVLVRIDPASPYQLQELAQYVDGQAARSLVLEDRAAEIALGRQLLEARREELLNERRRVLSEFGQGEQDGTQPGYGFLVGGLGVAGTGFGSEAAMRRKLYFARQEQFDRDQRAFEALSARFVALLQAYRDLGKVRVVASTLVWNQGHPVDGGSNLSRYFDDTPFRGALWFQAAGNTRGQAWSGLFRDGDGNGVMEFALNNNPPNPDRWWQLELNTLAWQPPAGERALDLPQGARLRISMQWREPHDPSFWQNGEDAYVVPLANPRLVLMRQPDPKGTKRPADDLEVVAYSVGPALRLQNAPSNAVYEQTLEFVVPQAGRYGLRVEGFVPPSIRPRGSPTLPALEKTWELRSRIFIETLEGPEGRCVFHDYATDDGTLGMPADARRVITIGAADKRNQREPFSTGGTPLNELLARKPNGLAYDRLVLDGPGPASGTSIAASWAAGLAASVLSSGVPGKEVRDSLPRRPEEVIGVARPWTERKPQR